MPVTAQTIVCNMFGSFFLIKCFCFFRYQSHHRLIRPPSQTHPRPRPLKNPRLWLQLLRASTRLISWQPSRHNPRWRLQRRRRHLRPGRRRLLLLLLAVCWVNFMQTIAQADKQPCFLGKRSRRRTFATADDDEDENHRYYSASMVCFFG
jgi:hypothetical protein